MPRRKKRKLAIAKVAPANQNNKAALLAKLKEESPRATTVRQHLRTLHAELRFIKKQATDIQHHIEEAVDLLAQEEEARKEANRQQSIFAGFIRDVQNNLPLEVASANAKARREGRLK